MRQRSSSTWLSCCAKSSRGPSRARCLLLPTAAGPHRLVFATGAWAEAQGRETFWPEVVLTFAVREPAEHHHVPLLLAPFAYSTYRGS